MLPVKARFGLASTHRAIGVVAACLLFYLGISGAFVQVIDLAAILRHAPATDPDLAATRESLDGPGNYAVIAPDDYAARKLPANLPIAASFDRAGAQGAAGARWIELRMEGNRPVVHALVRGATHRFDPATGQDLGSVPDPARPAGMPQSRHLVAKRWHRLWALGDGMLWIDMLGAAALAGLVVIGLGLWWRVYRLRRRNGRLSPWWGGGDGWRNVHRGLALVAAVPLLIVAVSGAVLSVDSFSLAIYRWKHPDRLAFGIVPLGMVADYSTPLTSADIHAMAGRALAAWHGGPVRVIRLRVFAGMPQAVFVSGDSQARQVVLDTRSGRAVSMSEPGYPDTVFPTGWEWHERWKRIHRGDWFGLAGRWLDLAAGLALAWLAGSGLGVYFRLWRSRRKTGRRSLFWR